MSLHYNKTFCHVLVNKRIVSLIISDTTVFVFLVTLQTRYDLSLFSIISIIFFQYLETWQSSPKSVQYEMFFLHNSSATFSKQAVRRTFRLHPLESGHNRSKIEHLRSLRISKILRLRKSYQRVLFRRLFVFCKM